MDEVLYSCLLPGQALENYRKMVEIVEKGI